MNQDHSEWVRAAAGTRADVAEFDLPQVDNLADAYGIQDAYAGLIEADCGGVRGFKLAVNGAPQMAHFGVSEPVWARIFADEIHQSGVALLRSGFSDVTIEPELAAVLGSGVAGLSGPVDRAGALAAIDRFHAAIELIDQRGTVAPQLQLPQAVALNVFNAGIVLGEGSLAADALDLANMNVSLDLDGTRTAEITGGAPQDPVEAVMWLLNQLSARGITVRPGMVVMCGTHLPMRTLASSTKAVSVSMSGAGSVSFSLQ